ncbi:transposase [Hyella patelloides LEGE 07179]|uniref:Transposase n=1 Tax=Hyella patelloides LEGE 07179 TaxID=945734 RepID=A0A563VML8_9CYAN|nr:IS630 transposase-related protein [Hyella patelloides]VEP12661.1 transposase [Hyella patelloides LEGE 07179]
MPYSLDLRKKIVDYVERGGGVTKAAQIFKVSRASIYRWLNRENLEATKVKRRQRKLDWEALKKDVRENPQHRLIDRAIKFEVQPSAILYALRQMKITRKKNNYVIAKEAEKKESNTIKN